MVGKIVEICETEMFFWAFSAYLLEITWAQGLIQAICLIPRLITCLRAMPYTRKQTTLNTLCAFCTDRHKG